jgi:hypothetical protein
MRSNIDRVAGVQLVTDPIGRSIATPSTPEPPLPTIADDREDRDLIALAGRLNAGVAVQLLLDRKTGETFVTTVVAGNALTVEVEGEVAWDTYLHPGFYGLLPQLAK